MKGNSNLLELLHEFLLEWAILHKDKVCISRNRTCAMNQLK